MMGSPGQREDHTRLERIIIEPGGVFEDVGEGTKSDRHPLRDPGGPCSGKFDSSCS